MLLLLLPFHFSTLRLRCGSLLLSPPEEQSAGIARCRHPSLSRTLPRRRQAIAGITLSLSSQGPTRRTQLRFKPTACFSLFFLFRLPLFFVSSSPTPLSPSPSISIPRCRFALPLFLSLPKTPPSVRKPLHTFRFATSRSVPRERLATIRPQDTHNKEHTMKTRGSIWGCPRTPRCPHPGYSQSPFLLLLLFRPFLLTTHAQQPVGVRVRL